MAGKMTRRAFMGTTAATTAAIAATSGASAANTTDFAPTALASPIDWTDLHTPALLLDADAMERNLAKMVSFANNSDTKVQLRPHTKTHKCPLIAQKQVDLGAIGICCAKVSEAEVMLEAGIKNILITSPVVTPEKISRVIALAKVSDGIQMVIDNPQNAEDFNAAAKAAGITLRIVMDMNSGTNRTGVRLGDPAVALAKHIAAQSHLKLDGVQAYSGHLMHVPGHETRERMTLAALERVRETVAEIEAAGIPVPTVTGGGTGTFDIDGATPGYTDLQVGSYLFMDAQYREIGDRDSEVFDYFKPSLFGVVTAISEPRRNLITMDGGYKAFASDQNSVPEFVDVDGLVYTFGGDEHGIVRTSDAERPITLGEKFRVIVSHCDPTVNLYDQYYVMRGGKVVETWPVAARGCSQ